MGVGIIVVIYLVVMMITDSSHEAINLFDDGSSRCVSFKQTNYIHACVRNNLDHRQSSGVFWRYDKPHASMHAGHSLLLFAIICYFEVLFIPQITKYGVFFCMMMC